MSALSVESSTLQHVAAIYRQQHLAFTITQLVLAHCIVSALTLVQLALVSQCACSTRVKSLLISDCKEAASAYESADLMVISKCHLLGNM
jgi:hypothetical protein